MKPESKLFIVKALRKFIGQDVDIGIKMYCCEPMRDFVEFCRATEYDAGLHITVGAAGMSLGVDNGHVRSFLMRGTIEKVHKQFVLGFCPFCGAKIEYIEEVNDETKKQVIYCQNT